MNISPLRAALIAATVIIVLALIILRPSQLIVHPSAEPSVLRTSMPTPPPQLRVRPLVYVAGAVVHPGVYAVANDARARDALALAGGATRDADLVAVNLAAHVSDGDEVAVPHLGDPPPAHARPSHRRASSGSHRRRRHSRTDAPSDYAVPAAQAARVDLNTADAEALAELPGVGPAIAQRIVDFRTLNGPFASVDELADVAGITPAHLDELETLVTVAR